MNTQIQELYSLGLEKFAGDEEAAKNFVSGFLKEAFNPSEGAMKGLGAFIGEGAGKALGQGVVALGLGLGIHGVSTMINSANSNSLRQKYETSLSKVIKTHPLMEDVDTARARSYAETIFKFAPHVACDPNLLGTILAHVIQGEGVDVTIMKTLTDLEAKLVESRKNSLFSPKSYL